MTCPHSTVFLTSSDLKAGEDMTASHFQPALLWRGMQIHNLRSDFYTWDLGKYETNETSYHETFHETLSEGTTEHLALCILWGSDHWARVLKSVG